MRWGWIITYVIVVYGNAEKQKGDIRLEHQKQNLGRKNKKVVLDFVTDRKRKQVLFYKCSYDNS